MGPRGVGVECGASGVGAWDDQGVGVGDVGWVGKCNNIE